MAGLRAASTAASTMAAGVGKSGSPAPNPITGRPWARISRAWAVMAMVADSAMLDIRCETPRALVIG